MRPLAGLDVVHELRQVPAAALAPGPDDLRARVELAVAILAARDRDVADDVDRRVRRRRDSGQPHAGLGVATFAGRARRPRSSARTHPTIAARPSTSITASSTSHVWSARSSGAADGPANVPVSSAALGGLGASAGRGRAPSLRGLAQGRDAAGVDAARARQAVLGLKPDHGGAGARAEAPVDRTGPVAAAQQPSLHLAHAPRAVRAGVAAPRTDAARRPAAREPPRRRSPTRRGNGSRISRPCQPAAAGGSPLAPNAAGAVIRVSAAASAARGHLRYIRSSPKQSSVYRPAQTPAEGPGTATRFSPGARAGR